MYYMIDNYDSFVYNLSSYFLENGQEILVRRADAVSLEEIHDLHPEGIILSPGPKRPQDATISHDVLNTFQGKIPILGVCIPGSVQVTELFHVETYATVFQLIANVQGQLRPELNAIDLLNATFPGGSITGAPKLRAMELIDQEEHCRRNLYTGSIGYLSLNGDCDFNIVIRSAVHQNGIYHLGVGGGITWESDPLFEYEETWHCTAIFVGAFSCSPGNPPP